MLGAIPEIEPRIGISRREWQREVALRRRHVTGADERAAHHRAALGGGPAELAIQVAETGERPELERAMEARAHRRIDHGVEAEAVALILQIGAGGERTARGGAADDADLTRDRDVHGGGADAFHLRKRRI